MFVRFKSVLPSSTPVECLFSFAGIITMPHRRCMVHKTFTTKKPLVLTEN